MRRCAALVIGIGATALAAVAAASDAGIERLLRSASGGALTVPSVGRDQLLAVPDGLTAEQRATRRRGEAFFNTPFVPAPSAATLRDGLGPLFNSASCESCHNNLGRGQPPAAGGLPSTSVVVQFSWRDEAGHWRPHPTYGSNLNPLAIDGVAAEGQLHVEYETVQGRYADGTEWTIRRPRHTIVDLAYGPLDGNTRFSPRMTPPVIGMGLLEAVPDASILALADPEDHDGDGISGRPNWIVGASADSGGKRTSLTSVRRRSQHSTQNKASPVPTFPHRAARPCRRPACPNRTVAHRRSGSRTCRPCCCSCRPRLCLPVAT